jgi:hypothetical protein
MKLHKLRMKQLFIDCLRERLILCIGREWYVSLRVSLCSISCFYNRLLPFHLCFLANWWHLRFHRKRCQPPLPHPLAPIYPSRAFISHQPGNLEDAETYPIVMRMNAAPEPTPIPIFWGIVLCFGSFR